MLRVMDVIKRLFPEGTRPQRGQQWKDPPFWPPDVFAIAATLTSLSGCYSRPPFTSHCAPFCVFDKTHLENVRRNGRTWSDGKFPREVTNLWKRLVGAGDEDVLKSDGDWCEAAIKLITIADEASVGIGFISEEQKEFSFADYLFNQHLRQQDVIKKGRRRFKLNPRFDLPNLPLTLCWMVPPSEVCVQPKARTPQVGCTLRSLTHHLALLPPAGEIVTSWLFGVPAARSTGEPLNLLLVPFPYHIDGSCFHGESDEFGDGKSRFFLLQQNWLNWQGRKLSDRQISKFLIELVKKAENEVRTVHGVILPECALDDSQVNAVAKDLGRRTELELFVSGVFRPPQRKGFAENAVYTTLFYQQRILTDWKQSKHHRWNLDRNQIHRYHLGDALKPTGIWWEKIEIHPRTCTFYVFRHGASLVTLVCEDLARIDPVQVALRSVGPNLVVVLLMDGPQIERRWPGRYATVLADDPGSAVLTLTCFGMVRRSIMPGDQEPAQIALWKEPGGVAQELKLPKNSHALLLTLTQSWETGYTLDGRSDREGTMRLSLSGVRGVTHNAPPKWA